MEKNSATQSLGLRDACPPNPICPHWVNPTSLSTQGFKSFKGCLFGWLMVKMLPLSAWWSNWCPFLLSLHKQQDQWVVLFMLHVVSNSYLLIYQKIGSQLSWPHAISACNLQYTPQTHKRTHPYTITHTHRHQPYGADCSCCLFVNLWFSPRLVIQLDAGSWFSLLSSSKRYFSFLKASEPSDSIFIVIC